MLIRPLLPSCVLVGEMDPLEADPLDLHPAELRQIERAVSRRRHEYSAGRLLARSLLNGLGVAQAPLLNRPNRTPAWSAGVVGSISHCATLCAVAVALESEIAAIGIDVELAEPLGVDVEPLVLTAIDRDSIARLPASVRILGSRLVFSAKEAIYKVLYPIGGMFIDFSDVYVEFGTNSSFTAAAVTRSPRVITLLRSIHGRFRIDGPHLATTAFALAAHAEGTPDRLGCRATPRAYG